MKAKKIYLVNDLCVHGLFDTRYAGTYFFTESGKLLQLNGDLI